ncbi:chalcone isomerase family protein [Oxalobacteraceae bacterium]|nr:chalcone isomerase family protein [Oxalobacteraceae bacterium]
MNRRNTVKSLLAAALLTTSFSLPVFAATEVAGVKFEDSISVGGKDLKLNGAGVRKKVMFKLYALGIYLPEKKSTVAEVLASPGPRRISINVLRELTSEQFGNAFMDGLNDNSDKGERNRIVPQTMKFGEIFAQIPGLKKGDVLNVDWLPGEGTVCHLNGKKVGDTLPEVSFYNAILRIWLGDKPVDSSLKPLLLNEK